MKGKPGLRPEGLIGEGLATFAHDILREGRAAIDEPDKPDAVAVHDFRKAMKRWRALLRLVELLEQTDARHLREEARDLARELAPARDRQSALDAVSDLEKSGGSLSRSSWRTIRARLETLRQEAEAGTLTEAARDRLRAAIETCDRAVDSWPLEQIEFRSLVDGLTRTYARARGAVPLSFAECDDESLHVLRQRVVVLRYQMPLAEPLWPRFVKVWVGEAQRLRERLGAHQDLTVLAALTAPHQPLAPWRARLAPLIAARKRTHVDAAARLCARLFAERPKAFRRRLQSLWDGAVKTGG
ncbi:MAG TPA: CHAD domain-containing protein [Xanthobacteraceae bacterium]|nr:CHAD domain-containing protein [Xanthobacteraceae bacterium]